jgi:hypothetical protein
VENIDWRPVITSLEQKETSLEKLKNQCGTNEKSIEGNFYSVIGWDKQSVKYNGLFGYTEFKADNKVTIKGFPFVVEVNDPAASCGASNARKQRHLLLV